MVVLVLVLMMMVSGRGGGSVCGLGHLPVEILAHLCLLGIAVGGALGA